MPRVKVYGYGYKKRKGVKGEFRTQGIDKRGRYVKTTKDKRGRLHDKKGRFVREKKFKVLRTEKTGRYEKKPKVQKLEKEIYSSTNKGLGKEVKEYAGQYDWEEKTVECF